MRQIIIVLALLGLVSCANVGSRFNISKVPLASDNAAIVFFYRSSRFLGGGSSLPIFANKIKIGTLDNGAYFKKVLSPGNYKIHSSTAAIDRISTFSFAAGKTYFIRGFIDMGAWVNSIRFVVVHEDEAMPEIEETAVQL